MSGQQCVPASRSSVEIIPAGQIAPAPKVTFETTAGKLVFELFPQQAPKTVENFLQYVREGFYVRTIIHETRTQVITGGAYNQRLQAKTTHDPIANESNNGLRNLRGRVAMYAASPDAETSQFFVNLTDNASIDYDPTTGRRGMTVFGKVVEGMPVADAMAGVETNQQQASDGVTLGKLPKNPIIITRVLLDGEEIIPPQLLNDQPPVANAGTNRVVAAGIAATLDGSASFDPDAGDELYYTWEQTGGPTVTLSSSIAVKPTFDVPAVAEALTFKLTAEDQQGKTSEAIVVYTVTTAPKVRMKTSMGDIVVDVLLNEAPITSKNFLQYVSDGFYDGTVFHRVIKDFVVQGGGYLPGLIPQGPPRDPIVNEFSADRPNLRGTLSMAKTSDPDSATSQFFINVVDNPGLDDPENSGGFAVFARVVEGMSVADAISLVPTTTRTVEGGEASDTPVDDVLLISATIE